MGTHTLWTGQIRRLKQKGAGLIELSALQGTAQQPTAMLENSRIPAEKKALPRSLPFRNHLQGGGHRGKWVLGQELASKIMI